ncbi:hypothetical protein SNE40_000520 [Patella caerulea]|uniref:Uncharacterized protein n=1 Tax=Patella caerulea TaxID=87958 RepID=A0AAN8QH20_PATCE
MNNNIGTEYCWIGDLYKRLGLPVLPNLIKEWEIQMKRKIKRREFTTSNAYRGAKTLQKKARSLEQLERKKWLNAKSLQHSYGTVSGDEDEESDDDSSLSTCSDPEQTLSGNAIDTFQMTVPSTSKCICGSVTHKRTSHRDCLLRKK